MSGSYEWPQAHSQEKSGTSALGLPEDELCPPPQPGTASSLAASDPTVLADLNGRQSESH